MRNTPLSVASLAFVAMLVAGSVEPANATPQTACAIVTVADVRAIVAAPVDVFESGSSAPIAKGNQTISTCTYASSKTKRGATFSLLWAPIAERNATYTYYVKRNQERARIKGDVLIVASVRIGRAIDVPASTKLLDAVLKNVR